MEEILVIGGGGHAKVLIGLLKKMENYKVLGYIDQIENKEILGVPCLGNDSQLSKIKKKHPNAAAVIGIGMVELSNQRPYLKDRLRSLSYATPTIISPTAIVNEEVTIGDGTVILDAVTINSGTTIGEYSIINTGSSIDHDCRIGDFVHLAPCVTLCGGVRVGNHCILGAGSTIIQYRTIMENCLVGAGATVIEDCTESGVYVGTPAQKKPIRQYAI